MRITLSVVQAFRNVKLDASNNRTPTQLQRITPRGQKPVFLEVLTCRDIKK